ncbi:MAG: DUF4349 domain-containing protein [Planctomycetota bacterium]
MNGYRMTRRWFEMQRFMILLTLGATCVFQLCGCGSHGQALAVRAPAAKRTATEGGHGVLGYGRGGYGGGGELQEAEMSAEAPVLGDAAFGEFRPAIADSPEVDPARTQRLVVYNAVMNVVVDRIADSIDQIKAAVEGMGGYMKDMSSSSLTLKVPADRFADAIAEVEKLGEVTRKQIKGTDVTEEMRDLDIRLRNAEEVRQRLVELLDRATKVEDALKIEKELARMTEKIELLKGKITHLKNSVAYSTLTVNFNSPVPQEDITARTPFRWVHELGEGLKKAVVSGPRESRGMWRQSIFEPPDGYVKYYEHEDRTGAMSAKGVLIDARRQKNYKGGNIEFWGELVRRVLVEQKVFSVKEQLGPQLKNKSKAVVFIAGKQIGTKEYGYLVALAAGKKHVYVMEAWGPLQEFEKDRSKLVGAVKSMRMR